MHHAGCWKLSREYSYYYQVQVQVNVCSDVKYEDFVVWTEGEMAMKRIYNRSGILLSAEDRVERFFIYGALPEIVGKWYTRKHVADKDGVVQPLTVYGYAVHLKINGTACHVENYLKYMLPKNAKGNYYNYFFMNNYYYSDDDKYYPSC